MTKEALIARKKLLETELERAIATANALKGALQDVEYWLGKADNGQSQEVLPAIQQEVLPGTAS
jgi:hypothetical protein